MRPATFPPARGWRAASSFAAIEVRTKPIGSIVSGRRVNGAYARRAGVFSASISVSVLGRGWSLNAAKRR